MKGKKLQYLQQGLRFDDDFGIVAKSTALLQCVLTRQSWLFLGNTLPDAEAVDWDLLTNVRLEDIFCNMSNQTIFNLRSVDGKQCQVY